VVIIVWRWIYNFPCIQKPITTTLCEYEVYSMQHFVIKFVSDLWQAMLARDNEVKAFNVTFNNISVLSCHLVLLVEVHRENYQPATSH
jgi:hypothetical protein